MNSCDIAIKRQAVVFACCDALEREGFDRFRTDKVDWPLRGGFHCWVGLNVSANHQEVNLSPFVGLHVLPVEKLWTATKAGKYPGRYDRSHATYSRHMGELVPDVPAFQFSPTTDLLLEARRLARLYSSIGLKFAQGIASYAALLPLLEKKLDTLGANPERYVSCLYLMGRRKEARAFVESFLVDNRDYFEGFAIPFLKILDNDPDGDLSL